MKCPPRMVRLAVSMSVIQRWAATLFFSASRFLVAARALLPVSEPVRDRLSLATAKCGLPMDGIL